MGLGSAALAVFSYNAIQIGLYGAFGYFASVTTRSLTGVAIPWWLWAGIGMVLVWFLGFRSIRAGSRVLVVLLLAETGILVLLATVVLIQGGAEGIRFDSFEPANLFTPGMASVLALVFGAFIGFEATAIYREEAKRPDRTVPLATYIAVAFLGVFYAFMAWMIVQAFGSKAVTVATSDPASMYFTAMSDYVGDAATTVMRILIVTSNFAALLAFHNAITRYVYALSSEGVLPRRLGHVHHRFHSPYVAGIAQTILAAVVVGAFALFGADPYLQMLLWVNTPGVLGFVVLQTLAAFAVWRFFRTRPHSESTLRTVVAPLVATVLLAGATVLIAWYVDLMTDGGPIVDGIILVSVPTVFLLGFWFATWMRKNRPADYARIGTTNVDADTLESH
jgi:amino acid transporter